MKTKRITVTVQHHILGELTAPIEFFYSDGYRVWTDYVMRAALHTCLSLGLQCSAIMVNHAEYTT